MYPALTFRPTARLIVVEPGGRILLFSADDPRGPVWFTPGGGVERGESLEGAAVRELAEETGYGCAEAALGPVVATCAGLWTGDGGQRFFGADSFFVVRVADATVDVSAQEPLERSVITGHRWWTARELRDSTDVIVPVGLSGLVDELAANGVPAAAVRLPWRRLGGLRGQGGPDGAVGGGVKYGGVRAEVTDHGEVARVQVGVADQGGGL